MRPEISDFDKKIYAAFCRALREAPNEIIPKQTILDELEFVECEQDIGLELIKRLNDYWVELKREKEKKDSRDKAIKPTSAS